jgi:hypothetical protein
MQAALPEFSRPWRAKPGSPPLYPSILRRFARLAFAPVPLDVLLRTATSNPSHTLDRTFALAAPRRFIQHAAQKNRDLLERVLESRQAVAGFMPSCRKNRADHRSRYGGGGDPTQISCDGYGWRRRTPYQRLVSSTRQTKSVDFTSPGRETPYRPCIRRSVQENYDHAQVCDFSPRCRARVRLPFQIPARLLSK